MKVQEIAHAIEGEELTPSIINENTDYKYAFSGDLMSDALMLLRNAPENFCEQGILITGNTTMQSVRTAEMLDFTMIIITRGKKPNDNVIRQAIESKISVLVTNHVSFSTCGILYQNGILGLTDLK